MNTAEFELIVIGSGPGGYKAAVTAAQLGARVALVEKAAPGGTCLNYGCVPKKTLVHLASTIEDVNALQGRGLIGRIHGDFRAAVGHKNQVVRDIRESFPVWLRRLGVRLYRGSAHFVEPRVVRVELEGPGCPAAETLQAARIILATGSAAREHPRCESDGARVLTSRDFMSGLEALPHTALCLGGGAIGTELGYLMHQFGAQVTIAEQAGRLLDKPGIPERASQMLERKLRRLGVEIRKEVSVESAVISDGGVHITFTDGAEGQYDQVLVAIGRRPVTEGLGLEGVGIERDAKGFVVTNEYLETTVAGVYAVGDVKRGPMTANAALHDAKVAATNAMKGNQLRINYNRVPLVIDSALEIAAVGLTEERAEEAGFEPAVARTNLSGSPKARARHDYEGFVEVVHDEETGQLLGGCIVGSEAGEQIQMITAACQSARGLWFFTDINYSHPSWCEELGNAIDPYAFAFTQSGREVFRPGIYATWEW
jgi:dihydrolipoamide dehydrogenase